MEMQDQNQNKESTGRGRKVAAGALLGLGVLGLGLAAVSQLNLGWNGNFQAGAVNVDANCQEGPITVSFGEPEFTGSDALPWAIANANFNDVSAACGGESYEASYKIGDEWSQPATGTVDGTSITLPIGEVDPQLITDFALTIYGE